MAFSRSALTLPTPSAMLDVGPGESRRWRAGVGWRRDPADAIVGAALAALAILAIGPVPALVPTIAVAVVTPVLWRVDVTHRRLPNVLVYPCALLTLAALGSSAFAGRDGVPAALVVSVLTALFFGVLSVGGGMGMGDLKLAVVLTTVLALERVDAAVLAVVVAFIAGGIAGFVVLLMRRTRSIPFGPFLLVGFWVAVVFVR
jgi:leader peptidase (prepilin peptidase)/N-methyltransferase